MKNLFKIFAIVMVALCASLTSCKKSNETLIKEYGELRTEIVKAAKDGDAAKISTLSEKGQKLAEEMDKRDFTDEQKEQILTITAEISEAVLSASGAADMFNSLSGELESESDGNTIDEPSTDDED